MNSLYSSLKSKVKPLSLFGKLAFVVLGLWLFMMSVIGFNSLWWVVSFSDCADPIIDTYYYLYLSQGLCVDSKENQISNYDDCRKWNTVADETTSDEGADDASKYNDARNLCIAAMVFSILFIFTSGASIISKNFPVVPQRLVMGVLDLLIIFTLVSAIGVSTQTYFTDVNNYFVEDACSEVYSGPTIGWVATFCGFVVSIIGLYFVACPYGQCLAESDLLLHQPVA